MDNRAVKYIRMYDKAYQDDSAFLSLYRETANYVYPLENSIQSKSSPGEDKMAHLNDTTAVFAMDDMVSGLSSTLIPPGQLFYSVGTDAGEDNISDDDKAYLQYVTEVSHEILFGTNFPMIHDEFLKGWCAFGDSGIQSEFTAPNNVDFKDFIAGHYHYKENSRGIVDTFIEKFEYTANQAFDAWGDEAGPTVVKEIQAEQFDNKHEFVHVIQPRTNRDSSRMDVMNMPFEEVYVSCDDKMIVSEGGQPEFKVHISRWEKGTKEARGRGVGVKILNAVKGLNQIKGDMIECGNRHNNPPVLINGILQGDYDNSPGAVNMGMGQTKIERLNTEGNFPITKEQLEMERAEIKSACLIDVFNQLINLTGDRRTTLEISERLNEGLRRLSKPVGRLIYEELAPLLKRFIKILIRNYMIAEPPQSLQGRNIKITFLSPLVLALRRYQANGFLEWVSMVGEMEQVFPGVKDNVDADEAVRDMADALGVKGSHKRSLDERTAIRHQRAAREEAMAAQEQAQMASDAYAKTTKAPEPGSIAEALSG